MLDKIVNNFGLMSDNEMRRLATIGFFGDNASKNKKNSDDKDSLDTFKELTRTIDEIIASLPNITIPSTIVGKTRYEGFKEVVNLYKKQNLSKFLLLSCTMANLIARHSGAKEVSQVAGFLQNCLALYSIGDNLCSHISFNWDYVDTMYIIVNNELEGGLNISMQKYREINTKCAKQNYDSLNLTNSSAFVLVNMAAEHKETKWFSSEDQKEHTIKMLRTNVKGVVRHWTRADDGTENYDLNYEFLDSTIVKGKPSNAIFEVQFDDVMLYIVQSVSGTSEDENSATTVYTPSHEMRYFWIPNELHTMTRKEMNMLNTNISGFMDMLFVNNIDTEKFMFTFSENGELTELVRPKAIPENFVSDKIPEIINAVKTLHGKKLSRCYALVGNAGTGKTIGAQQISNAFPDVCTFKITKNVIENEEVLNSMMSYVRAIKRCIIILDDMDRSNLTDKNDSVCAYLKFFDYLNQSAKNDQVSYVFIATINDPSKINKVIMCRSGRIDQMLEIGFPDVEALRYLFSYNDKAINPDNLTDFNDPSFDAEFKYAVESKITAADIYNIFSDMAVYGDTGAKFTPENVHEAIDHIKGRNDMANNNYLD